MKTKLKSSFYACVISFAAVVISAFTLVYNKTNENPIVSSIVIFLCVVTLFVTNLISYLLNRNKSNR